MVEKRGFIVSAWNSRGRILLSGRLEDGRSFAVLAREAAGAALVSAGEAVKARAILADLIIGEDAELWSEMSGAPLVRFRLRPGSSSRASRLLESAGLRVAALERGGAEDYLAERGISGGLLIRGEERPGRRAEAVFVEPELAPSELEIPLRWLALDIETARDESVLAVSLATSGARPGLDTSESGPGEVLFLGPETGAPNITSFGDEASLLTALAERVMALDPDVVTGWNVVDFDLRVLSQRFVAHRLSFDIGRSDGQATLRDRGSRGLLADIPGRSTIDAMRLLRASGQRYEDQSLETVAQNVLGEGKSVSASGEEKLAELERMYREEPRLFCEYCLRDSTLVLAILEKSGLARLTAKRAALTGLSLDLAWTSIPAFERVYAAGLRARRVAVPAREERRVSGAAGGTVLEPEAGIFDAVLVFDFRSLYPSVMRSFGVDPLAYERASSRPARPDDIVAPNGARFERGIGVLPEIIARYAALREAALASGDDTAAFVFKILQNSFYGVLGAEGCRYARTELAGAVTSFGRKYLLFSRDFFTSKGYRVLYGDTDSVFVASGLPVASLSAGCASGSAGRARELFRLGELLAAELNEKIAEAVRAEFDLPSFLHIRSEKAYARFFIPRLRVEAKLEGEWRRAITPQAIAPRASGIEGGAGEGRGRAKGYAGLRLDENGKAQVEVKGMEAARSDWTPLARRFQTELLGLALGLGGSEGDSGALRGLASAEELRDFCKRVALELRSGALDGELVYKKSLRRPPEDYASESPQVRAARLLGWKGRRGSVSYLMTASGAEPVSRRSAAPLDYEHYVEHQLLPIASSVADALARRAAADRKSNNAMGDWDVERCFLDRPQMELPF
jgi:DNA polymerase-2